MAKDDTIPEDDAGDLSELLGPQASKKQPDANLEDYPNKLPLIVITQRIYVPNMAVPIVIEPGPYFELLKEVSQMEDKLIGIVLAKDKDADIYNVGFDDIYDVGVVARVLRVLNVQDAGAHVIFNMDARIKIKGPATKKKTKYLIADVEYHKESVPKGKKDIITAYASNIITTIRELLSLNPIFREELQIVLSHSEFAQPYKLCDFAVALTTASREELQEILATFDLTKRMEKALVLLKKELDISRLQAMINTRIESTVAKSQREYILKEQLKMIQKELGMSKDDKAIDIEKFKARAEQLEFSEEVQKVFDEEIEKLGFLDIQSAEYSVVRGYVDWLTVLPWGISSPENERLTEAEAILEEDHFGLKDVKERISETISISHLQKTGTKAQILCLVGPPGVGKTSIARSIARALGREFFRLSVGGVSDEAEIKGHRKTYIGAMPGKLIQALKTLQVNNPVFCLDEIDKLASSFKGDPAAALLEVLDPEQNKEFLDHYLDVRFDLSNILFIVTANTTDTIPAPLLDRMEVIRISGYILEEKMEIAKKYLVTKNRKAMGLKTTDICFNKQSIRYIIESYNREAGVRGLERSIKKIMRKVATEKVRFLESLEDDVKDKDEKGKKNTKEKAVKKVSAKRKAKETFERRTITPAVIEKYLGLPIFTPENFYAGEKVTGVAMGLAWTSMGGATLYVEAVMNKGKTPIRLTGNVREIMKESSLIAFTYLMSTRDLYLPKDLSFEDVEMHLHVPDGATPKDGPSAGITITTAMISLCIGKSVPTDLAMTGEITIRGRVLPIGGLKEKIIAAKRDKIKRIIAPFENLRDFDELADYLKAGLKFYFVKDYQEVYDICFKNRDSGKVVTSKKSKLFDKAILPIKKIRKRPPKR